MRHGTSRRARVVRPIPKRANGGILETPPALPEPVASVRRRSVVAAEGQVVTGGQFVARAAFVPRG